MAKIKKERQSEYITIGGEKRYGSGKIVSGLLEQLECKHISTNQLHLFGLLKLCNLRGAKVVFFPSIAKWSFLRDILIFLILCTYRAHVTTVVLCDLRYSHGKKITKLTIRLFSKRILAPAKIDGLTVELFRQVDRFSPSSHEARLPGLVFGNYLSSDKGIGRFSNYINKDKEIEYCCFGTKANNEVEQPIEFTATETSLEFSSMMHRAGKTYHYFFYASKYDLAPLVVSEALNAGMVIVTLSGYEDSIEILENYIGKGSFLTFDEEKSFSECISKFSKCNIEATVLKARSAIESREKLIELVEQI